MISVEIRRIKNYINGEWVEADNNGYLDVENPSTGDIISQVPLSTVSETERTLEAAYKAFTSWRNTPVAHRVSFLFKLQAIVRTNENKIARILAEEKIGFVEAEDEGSYMVTDRWRWLMILPLPWRHASTDRSQRVCSW